MMDVYTTVREDTAYVTTKVGVGHAMMAELVATLWNELGTVIAEDLTLSAGAEGQEVVFSTFCPSVEAPMVAKAIQLEVPKIVQGLVGHADAILNFLHYYRESTLERLMALERRVETLEYKLGQLDGLGNVLLELREKVQALSMSEDSAAG